MQAFVGQDSSNSPSPITHWLKGTLELIEEGHVIMRIPTRADMMNPGGTLHGGVSSMILDDVIGAAVYTLHDENFHTSVNLTVDFLSVAKPGDNLKVEAKVVRYGKTMVNCDGFIYSESGKLVARATSNLIRTPNKAFRPA